MRPMRLGLDWWAVILAAVAATIVKSGLVSSIPW